MELKSKEYFFTEPQAWNEQIDVLKKYLFKRKKNNPLIILLGGPSGIGKSSIAIKLSELLGIRNLISTDLVKFLLGILSTNPLLKFYSHNCWKIIGKFSEENLIIGFKRQSKVVCNYTQELINDAIRHKKHTIIEGIHLLPSILNDIRYINLKAHIVKLYITCEFSFFTERLLLNRTLSTYMHKPYEKYHERMKIYRTFFEMWNCEFQKYNINPLMNNYTPEDIIESTLDRIIIELKNHDNMESTY